MTILLSVLTFAVVTWMAAGFIEPAWAIRWEAPRTRGRVLLWGLTALVLLGLLFWLFW